MELLEINNMRARHHFELLHFGFATLNSSHNKFRELAPDAPQSFRMVWVILCALLLLSGWGLKAAPTTEPSHVGDVVPKPAQPTYDLAADAKRMKAMSPEELAWERVLEQNLGDYYLPRYKAEMLTGKSSPWDFVKDDPTLPRVLLIGDSISCGYTRAVRRLLAGKANVHRAPANCGSTGMGLKSLSVWLGDGRWDLIHFNFGIWDRSTASNVYAANLEQIVTQLEKTRAKLIWARTTPPASADNAEEYSPAQCEMLNSISDEIIKKHAIAVDDLCTLVQPRLSELQITNNVHFKADGYEVLGKKVAEQIQKSLGWEAPRHTDRINSNHWFAKSGLGLFVHWGLASIPGNLDLSWGMMRNTTWDAELNNQNKLAPAAYYALAKQFNPTNFCPERWLKAAKDAGFGYVVLTTRHHDGFALWPSKFGDLNVGKFLPGRDLVGEYVQACRKVGMKVGFYYSPPDWYYHRAYQSFGFNSKGTPESPHLGLNWEPLASLPQAPPDVEDGYIKYVNGQITELMTWYGPIDYLWFDGTAGPKVISQDQIRKLQPGIIINDRQHLHGDVVTCGYEETLPATRPGGWWEHCFSMVGAWGYTKPVHYKPASLLIGRIAQVSALGGNVLANYGPQPDGNMPDEFYQQMAELKQWRDQKNDKAK